MKTNLKKIFMSVILPVMIVMCGCGLNTTYAKSKSDDGFDMSWISESQYIRDYRDDETGVHYLVYDDMSGCGGMCPRYNADGSLYVD